MTHLYVIPNQSGELEEDWVPNDTTEPPYWSGALYLQIPLEGELELSCVFKAIIILRCFLKSHSPKLKPDAKN